MMTTATHRPNMQQLKSWCNGTWLQEGNDTTVEELSIDTRKIGVAEECLFIALKTEKRDGHQFIKQAYDKGVRCFLVSTEIDTKVLADASIIKVEDTLSALQTIVAHYRSLFRLPVIGITGSNGKTIVKEWLGQLLSTTHKVVRSPKSYNSQIGVPLSVWLLSEEYDIAVFEAGISQPGEMSKLASIIQPEIGVFTNITEAHSEGFENDRQKVEEKLKLFHNAKQLVYCKDQETVADEITKLQEQRPQLKLFSWSRKQKADLQINKETTLGQHTTIEATYKDNTIGITIPFADKASVENAIQCWCVLLLLDIKDTVVKEQMLALHRVSMRMEVVKGVNNCTVINDSYNSDFTSLQIALEYLGQQWQHEQHTLVLSDMMQMAWPDELLYQEVAELVAKKSVTHFIGIGSVLSRFQEFFIKQNKYDCNFYQSTEEFLKDFPSQDFQDEAILLKGARPFAFERIGALLEEKTHDTKLSIDLTAIADNLNVIRAKVGRQVKIMAMVKAFSYGAGSYEVANLLQYSGISYLSVAYTDEGIALRKAGISMPIMVMNPDIDSFSRMIAWKLEPEIYNKRSLEAILKVAKMMGATEYPIHLKLDTGMHRLGFTKEDLAHDCELLYTEEGRKLFRVASVFSHLAASEDEALDDFTQEQASRFGEMTKDLERKLGYEFIKHIANSAAIIRHSELHYDMVRLGISLYGIDSSSLLNGGLRQASTLITTIAQIKDIPAGETVGYGRKGIAEQNMKIATVSIGYADGYPRAMGSGKAYMLVRGQKAKLVGNVCMDMCMIDVTDIDGVQEGEEVIVFGEQLPVRMLAQWADTISYEILTNISGRVKRVYEHEV